MDMKGIPPVEPHKLAVRAIPMPNLLCYSSGKKTFLVQLGTPISTELANSEV